MHIPILKLVIVVLAAAFCSSLTMFFNIRAGRSSLDEGRLALGAVFFGWCIGFAIFFWSFTIDSKILQWTMWAAGLVFAVAGIVLETYLTTTREVQESPGKSLSDKGKTTGLAP